MSVRLCSDEEAWRETIRRQLEDELNKRVREALDAPLSQNVDHAQRRHRRSSPSPRPPDADGPPPAAAAELTEREKQYFQSQKWKVLQVKRQIRQIMSDAEVELLRSSCSGPNSGSLVSELKRSGNTKLFEFLGALDDLPGGYKSRKYYSDLAERAAADFSELTSAERHSFYYIFTRSGFLEAVKTGRLPDGSELTAVGGGRYRDQYGLVRDANGPFWPIDVGPLYPAPPHRRTAGNPTVEPLLGPCTSEGK